jgi:integrase
MSAARLAAVPAAVDVTVWEDERERFARSSRAAGRAETTITVYDYSVLTLQRWAVDVDPDGTRTGPPVTDQRARSRHKDKRLPNLWLASEDRRGTLGSNGVAQMIERRATVAGVTGAHAHRFRHTAAHAWFSAGGSEGQAMLLFGWTSRDMCDRYGKSAATERAVEAARRLSPGDRI